MSRTYPQRPWVGVGVVVARGTADVLLILRANPPNLGQWTLPGGVQDLGETVFQTAVREVREETGLTVVPRGIITVVDSIHHDDAGHVEYHYTLVEVLAAWLEGEPAALDDAAAVRWAGWDEALALVEWEETRRVLRLSRAMVDAWSAAG
ncbi:MAG: NUDIX hydrolase [Rhodospirillaceae bacterium]|nr:NUDIX hydrolase [Rhodospirillaceae bacterium]